METVLPREIKKYYGSGDLRFCHELGSNIRNGEKDIFGMYFISLSLTAKMSRILNTK